MTQKRLIAKGLLIIMSVLCVAPFVGANDNNITISIMAQESKNLIFSDIYKKYRERRFEETMLHNIEDTKESNSSIYTIDEEIIDEMIEPLYVDYPVPNNNSFKSYMGYQHITDKTSSQYALKSQYILDYETGIYTVDGRYCCALGSYYSTNIGIYFDIIMTSGSVIPCILADCKDDKHTDELNQYTMSNNSVVEFIVKENVLIPKISNEWGNTGDVSYLGGIFEGEIDYIRIYY